MSTVPQDSDPKQAALKSDPLKSVGDVMQSQMVQEKISQFPEWDVPPFSPENEYVVARRELTYANKNLSEKREDQAEKRLDLDRQWQELRDKEVALKKSSINFEEFFKENIEKRERAERKLEDERNLQTKRDAEISDLNEKLMKLTEIKNKMESSIKEYSIYENYLKQIVEESPEFKSIYDVLDRYETLLASRNELAGKQTKDLEDLEIVRNSMLKLIEDKSLEIMALTNKFAELHGRYEKVKNKSSNLEIVVSRIKKAAAMKALECEQVKKCSWNMYQLACKYRNEHVTLGEEDIEKQLVFIAKAILELKRVVRITKKKMHKDDESNKPNTSVITAVKKRP